MSKLRIKNATLFVAVLSACLGLVAAGASSHARQTASTVLSEIAYPQAATVSYRSASKSLKLTASYNSPALSFAAQSETGGAAILYRNPHPLTAANHILVVTSLPRASIEDATA
jgi:hypothetical protein